MKSLSLAFCVAGLAIASHAHAQTTENSVTKDSLPGLLTGLGYEPVKASEGVYRITIAQDKFTFRMNLSLSPSLKKLWLTSYLVEITDLTKVPANLLVDTMLANHKIGPAHFMLSKVGEKHWLRIGYGMENRNITPAILRSEIEWFIGQIKDTATVWDKAKWPAVTTP